MCVIIHKLQMSLIRIADLGPPYQEIARVSIGNINIASPLLMPHNARIW